MKNTKRSEAMKAAWARRKADKALYAVITEKQIAALKPCTGPEAYHDSVNHPSHYTSHPSGVECIQITEHLNFCVGNAVKYAWRAGEKGNYVQDLEKAVWYLQREIARVSK